MDQPQIDATLSYIHGGIVTIFAIFAAKYGVQAAMLIAAWVQNVIAGRSFDDYGD